MKQRNAKPVEPGCSHQPAKPPRMPDAASVERAARLFHALGDAPRLALLCRLAGGERCVTELVAETGEKFPTVSQRLRVLRSEGLIRRRRAGLHVYYALADGHVAELMANALAHAGELNSNHPHTEDDE